MEGRKEKLLRKRAAIDACLSDLRSREMANLKKEDTRRKILLGALVLHLMERGKVDRDFIYSHLDAFLVRQGDRSLFDLPIE